MSIVDDRIRAYRRFVKLPWAAGLSGSERVWLLIYPPTEERRIRRRIDEFGLATTESGHRWALIDLTPTFAEWMAGHQYREQYFKSPATVTLALGDFAAELAARVRTQLESDDVDHNTVVGLLGSGALFGLGPVRVSKLIEEIDSAIRGRLLVFFPGERDGHNYRLLDARDGWSYLAIAIDETEEPQ
jgi:hypothetical protein